jgi:hypothetical protein
MKRLLPVLVIFTLVFLSGCGMILDNFMGEEFGKSDSPDDGEGSVPARVTGVNAVSTSGGIAINWIPVPGATEYRIYSSSSSTGDYNGFVYTSFQYYVDTDVDYYDTWYYKVAAINSNGEGPQSAPVSATYTGGSSLSAPTGLSASASGTSITLTWNSISGASLYYYVYRSTSLYGTYGYIGTTSAALYTDSGLSSGTYYYKVSIVSSGSESSQSGSASATVSGGESGPITNITYSSVSGGTWTLQSDGSLKSPAVGNSAATKARVSFTSTVSNASITIQLAVSSESGGDWAFISKLDDSDANSDINYYTGSKISGTTSKTVTIPVPTPGSHFIEIWYKKDSGLTGGSDCAWFKVVQ